MIPSIRPHALRRGLLAAAGILAWAGAAGMAGCKPSDLEAAPEDSVTQDTAVLRITNKLDIDPDVLTFYLFPGTSSDFANASIAKKIGSIPMDSTRTFTVPAGTWKLGYANSTGVLTPLRSQGGDEWPKCVLAKDGDFFLILGTDGPDIVWIASFPTKT